MRTAGILMVALMLVAGCTDNDGRLDVTNARIGQPTGPNAALYFTATSNGEADSLLSARTAAAESMELHETTTDADGTMAMQRLPRLDLPADGTIVLEPGGHHLMLVEAQRMEIGEKVEVTLTWEKAGEMTITAEVVDPGDTLSHDG